MLVIIGVVGVGLYWSRYYWMMGGIIIVQEMLFRGWQVYTSMFNKRQSYDPAPHQEEIDYGDSVAVGYSEKQGRDLFWEKHSVEGI
jgi:hypothetical protein